MSSLTEIGLLIRRDLTTHADTQEMPFSEFVSSHETGAISLIHLTVWYIWLLHFLFFYLLHFFFLILKHRVNRFFVSYKGFFTFTKRILSHESFFFFIKHFITQVSQHLKPHLVYLFNCITIFKELFNLKI